MGTIRDRTAASEQKELFSVEESNKNISSQKYTLLAENTLLKNELARWQARVNHLLEVHDKMDPEEFRELQTLKGEHLANLAKIANLSDSLKQMGENLVSRTPGDLVQYILVSRTPGNLIQYILVSRTPGDLVQYILVSRTPGDLIQYTLVSRIPGDLVQYNLVSRTLGDLIQYTLVNRTPGTLYSLISLVEHQGTLYSILSLVEHQGTVEISSPYPEFVLTGVTKYWKALKGIETVYILT